MTDFEKMVEYYGMFEENAVTEEDCEGEGEELPVPTDEQLRERGII